jgi:antitoxin (DNA-binding transcriptional repressor) of toxin-antitoxin stability system
MDTFELAKAKDQLEDLIRLAAAGEDIRITDARYGTMRLVPVLQNRNAVIPQFDEAKVRSIIARVSALPILDDRTADEIIGYDEFGVPE